MSIEVASYPQDLASWGAQETPFYLEVFGETAPVIDEKFAEVVPAGSGADGTPKTSTGAPVYEYWWTIGHPGLPSHRSQPLSHLFGSSEDSDSLWTKLGDPAARVYLYFPLSGGWRIKELIATVKYLSPVPKQDSLWQKAAQEWQVLSPLVTDASTLASAVGPEVGLPAQGAVKTLDAIAKLKINSLPQTEGFEWSVGKVTFRHHDDDPARSGVMQGVVWVLPKAMFTELGGRLTGSLAVTLIPCQRQGDEASAPQPRDVLAHAVVYGHQDPIWAPGQREFVHLTLSPTKPVASG